MTLILLYLVVLILIGIVLFGVASLVFGRVEELPPLPRATTATVLPASGVTGADVEAVKFTQVLRGYKTSEVDWVLDRLGSELDQLRGELAGDLGPALRDTYRHMVTEGPYSPDAASAGRPFDALLAGDQSGVFWLGFVGCGILAPLAIEASAFAARRSHRSSAVAVLAVLVLVGGLSLRFVLVNAGVQTAV